MKVGKKTRLANSLKELVLWHVRQVVARRGKSPRASRLSILRHLTGQAFDRASFRRAFRRALIKLAQSLILVFLVGLLLLGEPAHRDWGQVIWVRAAAWIISSNLN